MLKNAPPGESVVQLRLRSTDQSRGPAPASSASLGTCQSCKCQASTPAYQIRNCGRGPAICDLLSPPDGFNAALIWKTLYEGINESFSKVLSIWGPLGLQVLGLAELNKDKNRPAFSLEGKGNLLNQEQKSQSHKIPLFGVCSLVWRDTQGHSKSLQSPSDSLQKHLKVISEECRMSGGKR